MTEKIRILEDKVKFVRTLLQNKDEVIRQKQVDICYRDTKITNLEAMLEERDIHNNKLTQQIEELAKIVFDKDVTNLPPTNLVLPDEDEILSKDKEQVKNVPDKKVTWKKCPFEDKGKCKMGGKCPNDHPKGVCRNYRRDGNCRNQKTCKLRHPSKNCFEWERKKIAMKVICAILIIHLMY